MAYMAARDDLPLVMTSPDAGAAFRLDPSLPRDAQQIVVSARPGTGSLKGEVVLQVDGQPLAQFSAPPYRALWQLEAGRHVFSAEGVSRSGERVVSDEIWVEVHE
jgi:hypothetical protein